MKKTTRKVSKKRVTTKKKVDKTVFSAKDLKPADYNPRSFDEDAKNGLSKSIDKFKDISGITWNSRTRNIVTGHHRWEELLNKYGLDTLEFEHLKGDRHAVLSEGEDTGYTLRVVDWDLGTEKAANVTANSNKIAGQFTADLSDLIEDIKIELDDVEFSDLRLDDLSFDMEYLGGKGKNSAGDDDWDSDIDAIKKVDKDDQQMYSNITITCKVEDKARILEAVKSALESEELEVR